MQTCGAELLQLRYVGVTSIILHFVIAARKIYWHQGRDINCVEERIRLIELLSFCFYCVRNNFLNVLLYLNPGDGKWHNVRFELKQSFQRNFLQLLFIVKNLSTEETPHVLKRTSGEVQVGTFLKKVVLSTGGQGLSSVWLEHISAISFGLFGIVCFPFHNYQTIISRTSKFLI